jgi:hypothetical protein
MRIGPCDCPGIGWLRFHATDCAALGCAGGIDAQRRDDFVIRAKHRPDKPDAGPQRRRAGPDRFPGRDSRRRCGTWRLADRLPG